MQRFTRKDLNHLFLMEQKEGESLQAWSDSFFAVISEVHEVTVSGVHLCIPKRPT